MKKTKMDNYDLMIEDLNNMERIAIALLKIFRYLEKNNNIYMMN